ncbi:MAG: sigma-54 dependent transcriptional regulator [Bacteroidota bacterium]|nr:sigma-54 dependent transcriptional regulator [Bacteroidota bacterium]
MSHKLLGDSVQIKEINVTIKQVAPTDVSILITGESGSGKEVVANSIHDYSKRNDKPFIIVNCGAIPEGIIESELFGHQKGAFTGAIEERRGYFEMADKGTIFLDEIGDMPLGTQVKFLRVLETGEFMRVGGNKTIKVDVRVIAATNKDLSEEVLHKNFREDLFYRLRSINIYIPPLRERKSDIKILFDNFIDGYCRSNNINFKGIEDDAMQFLLNYVWNGNARELKNFCESIIVLYPEKKLSLEDVKKHLQIDTNDPSRSLPILFNKPKESPEKDFLFRALLELKSDIIDIKNYLGHLDNKQFSDDNRNGDFSIPKEKFMNMTMDEIEKEVIIYLLQNNYWNVERVAVILKQTPRNIYRKMKLYNLSKEEKWKEL